MYKCNCCGALFQCPNEKIIAGEIVDEGFGYGSHKLPDRLAAECPECKSEDFERVIFDGYSCPNCGKDIAEDIEQASYTYKCPHCDYELEVIDGKWVDE